MSRNFLTYPLSQYVGTPFIKPISVYGINGQSVPIHLNWNDYQASTSKPNIVVQVDMSNQLVASKIQILRSVYIDNTGSDVPVYVIFPDTGCVVPCQPNCAIWAPCYTAGMIALVAGLGFLTGDIPTTQVTFTNLIIPPAANLEIQTAVSLWKASATITRGTTIYNTNLGVPALGDQYIQALVDPTVSGGTYTVFNFGINFIYVTEIIFDFVGVQTTTLNLNSGFLVFESTGAAGQFLQAGPIQILASTTTFPTQMPNYTTTRHGQYKLDGSQLWRLRWQTTVGTFSGGAITCGFSYTTNPQ